MTCLTAMEYLCHKYPRICSICRKHFLVLCSFKRRVWRYQRGNQNPYIEEQTTQWPKERVQKYKQWSTKHRHKTKDRVTRNPTKNRWWTQVLRKQRTTDNKSNWTTLYIYIYGSGCSRVVKGWSRALDVRLSEWCCSVSMVWVQIPSREEQKFDSSKI
jgi:hypothetical protein